jgi:outer membrane protein assembly factor BamB
MVVVELLRFRHVESAIFLIPPKRTSCQLRTPLMLLRTLITGILWLNVCVLICPAGQPSAETRQFIAADSSKQKVALIAADGQTIWQHRIGPLHDLHVLPDGHVLMQLNWTEVVEIVPGTGEIVWRYDAAKQPANQGVRIEIHAFQRLPDGATMVAESGPARLIELTPDLQVRRTIPLQVAKPDPHHDTRLVRHLASGNYLVCHETEGLVREYRPDGTTAWEYQVPLFGRERRPGHGVDAFGNQVFSALRLPGGNTLIGTGNGHSVLEVTPAGQVVWSLHQNDLPGIQLAWVTSLQVLPSGNLLINNCHAGPDNPQLIEVSRDKKVVWSFRDFERFGDSLTNSVILQVNGKSVLGAPPASK